MSQTRTKITLFPKKENVPCMLLEMLVPKYQMTGCHNPEQKSLYPEEGSTEIQQNTLVHYIYIYIYIYIYTYIHIYILFILYYITSNMSSAQIEPSTGRQYKRTYTVKQHNFLRGSEMRKCKIYTVFLCICLPDDGSICIETY